MSERPKADNPSHAVTLALGEYEWRQDRSKYTSADEFIGFLRERGFDVTPIKTASEDMTTWDLP